MNECLLAYKKRKYLESKARELNRRWSGRVPDDNEQVEAELRKEYGEFCDKSKDSRMKGALKDAEE